MSLEPPISPTKRTVKRFAPLSVGKVAALVYGAIGLIFMPLFLLGTVATSNLPAQQRGIFALMGVGFAFAMPIFYAVIGFIGAVISAAIYNLAAKWVGGIEVEVE